MRVFSRSQKKPQTKKLGPLVEDKNKIIKKITEEEEEDLISKLKKTIENKELLDQLKKDPVSSGEQSAKEKLLTSAFYDAAQAVNMGISTMDEIMDQWNPGQRASINYDLDYLKNLNLNEAEARKFYSELEYKNIAEKGRQALSSKPLIFGNNGILGTDPGRTSLVNKSYPYSKTFDDFVGIPDSPNIDVTADAAPAPADAGAAPDPADAGAAPDPADAGAAPAPAPAVDVTDSASTAPVDTGAGVGVAPDTTNQERGLFGNAMRAIGMGSGGARDSLKNRKKRKANKTKDKKRKCE